ACASRFSLRVVARGTSTNLVSLPHCARKIRTTKPLHRYAPLVRTGLLAVLVLSVAGCGPVAAPRDTPPSDPIALPSPPVEPALPTSAPTPSIGGPPGIANPTLVPTTPPSLPPIREFDGIDFALMPGPRSEERRVGKAPPSRWAP